MHIVAEVHNPEDNDSGHSSSYEVNASSPVEADDYLMPIEPANHKAPMPESPITFSSVNNPSYIGVDDAAPLIPAPAPPPSSKSYVKPTISKNGPKPAPPSSSSSSSSSAKNSSSYPNDYRKLKSGHSLKSLPAPPPNPTQIPSAGNNDTQVKQSADKSSMKPTSLDAPIPRFHSNTKVYSQGGRNNSNAVTQQPNSTQPSANPPSTSTPSSSSSNQTPSSLPLTSSGASDHTSSQVPTGYVNGIHARNGVLPPRFVSTSSSGYNSDASPCELTPPPDYRLVMDDVTENDITV